MKAWIIYNGFLPGKKFLDFAQMLQQSAAKLGHDAKLMRNDQLIALLHHDQDIFLKKEKPDYIIFTDKDIYLAEQLETHGIPVFNSASAIEISDDKIKTYLQLHKYQIPIPKTIVAPKTFGMETPLRQSYLESIIEVFQFPLIIKEAFGSFGKQVYLIHNKMELEQITRKLSKVPYLFQQFIHTSEGRDIRLQVVGNQVVCGILRKNDTDFRANITNGGKMEIYEPNDDEKTIAIKASQAIGADFSGVDLLFGKNGEMLVCEVNSNAHIRNLLDCTGINAADDILHYIVKKVKEEQ